MTAPSPWLKRGRTDERADVALVCVPHAGGGASSFNGWQTIDPRLEVIVAQLPGREARIREAPPRSVEEAASALARAIDGSIDKPIALLGHSLGALVAFATAARIGGRVTAVFVSACRAPSAPPSLPARHLLGENELLEELRRLGGMPTGVLQSRELLELVMPTLRADLAIAEQHDLGEARPIEAPICAIVGREDASVHVDEAADWRRYTTADFELHALDGGHFYLHPPSPELVRIVVARALSPTR